MLLKDNILGMSWVASEDEYTDVLIGRFEDFDKNEVERFTEVLRKTSPRLGTEIVRGGQFVKIPVRQPLSLMVADGYAAIGDSAFMTVPLIGSGIANSLRASKILADTVIADKNDSFSAESLWPYQYNFFKSLGTDLAVLAAAKLLMAKLNAGDVDFLFESGTVTDDDITFGANFTGLSSMTIKVQDLLNKAKQVCKNMDFLKKLPSTGVRISAVTATCATIPRKYNSDKVRTWKKVYEKTFKTNL
jgi:flavin-dependent dehydrogenase